jgi:aryl-alcohol dehydrogenase-like predicted oxidoreductase
VKIIHLGNSGLRVSSLCLGGMYFGSLLDASEASAQMDAFVEAGGNFIDTANVYARWLPEYGAGVSERAIGRWLRERGNRASVVVASKARGPVEGAEGLGLSDLTRALEGTLQRLGTDYLDLYWAHWDDWDTPLEETLHAFQLFIGQGKIRYFGLSNYYPWRVARALDICRRHGWYPPVGVQPQWSLARRLRVFGPQVNFDEQYFALCREEGLAVVPYSPLAAGFLTGKYTAGAPAAESRTDRDKEVRESFFSEENWERLRRAQELAEHHGWTVAEIALAWLVSQPIPTVPIVGASSVAQLRGSLQAGDRRLAAEECKHLSASQ